MPSDDGNYRLNSTASAIGLKSAEVDISQIAVGAGAADREYAEYALLSGA